MSKTQSDDARPSVSVEAGHAAVKIGTSRSFRWATAVGLLVVVGAGIGAASSSPSLLTEGDQGPPRVSTRVLGVETVRVAPVTSFSTARDYTGTIVARRVSELSFELNGLVRTIHIDEGKTVAAGTPLASLDTEHLRTRRRETIARRGQAAALLAEMMTGPRQEDIDAARAKVESLEAQVELLRLQTDRSRRLLDQNAVAQDEYDQFAFGLKARRAQTKQARHELAELVNGTRQEQIDGQKALVAQLDAAIEDIDVDLRKSELKAPFAGTVSHRRADEGTVVPAGQAIVTLVEDTALEAWVGLPVEATTSLSVGSEQRVRIEGRTFDARVSGRRPEVDPATRTRTVIFRLARDAADFVVHGQIVRLQLKETIEASGFWLPTTALTEGERGLWSCLVAVPALRSSEASVARRDIEVLHTESDRVLVRGTLNAGDHVIARGTHRVSVGQNVKVVH